ncbi:PREDICTED: BTB/POZ domain-containing protein At2g30600 [Tarenaya hassleriana]|uniref:BTB/POZ domain-containing protein At2g30600 n=1 Tax=Tarenaya hassleriana TaxID=28532 RepID=UPI00053C5D9E|nr:PREDICTED: BTB/POZ domain-containing protein At2g30600 [Tarenaya hassleriana]XP_010556055.1 PREDICTED: BTB/POZ domain-containing protein At2g30600 [Tarenaya hassleriana]XP_010556056.1 PREDICTED: BTB/POZ domain-containing protein At2g30600 [Tarenaya hassleriana]
MVGIQEKKFLTVAPFECAWREDLKFREPGRGCVAFDAFAHNDVTVVFRENVGSRHYHYKKDNSPHYIVIIGSNRNRRLKILVDGRVAVDEEGIGLCCSSGFQSYWIGIYDGLISIGEGRYPFQNLVFQWHDTKPNCNVQYVGLSSWDKHVGYRNVSVFPLTQNHILLWKQVDCHELKGEELGDEKLVEEEMAYEQWGCSNFLESWQLSDMFFVIGEEETPVPAHKVILQASGNFPLSSSDGDVIRLREVTYPILHALLQYIYTGRVQISESELASLRALSSRFEVVPLVRQCEENMEQLKLRDKAFEPCKKVKISCPISQPLSSLMFPCSFPVNVEKLKMMYSTGEYCDVKINAGTEGLTFHCHKAILSLWSVPFAKMFTNGMSESRSSEIFLSDVSAEVFKAMVNFMYSGELRIEDTMDFGTNLLHLLFLADRFGVIPLHQECCKMVLECLSEDSVCSVLRVVSSISSCKLIEEMCKRKFSMHFDYCTTASLDFVSLDQETFSDILESADLTVTSEEKVLNAILMWCIEAEESCSWEVIDELMGSSNAETLFKERLHLLDDLLPHVRFSLLPHELLKKLESSNLSRQIPVFSRLVKEASSYLESGVTRPGKLQMFQHRRSSYKELQYICDGDSNGVLHYAGTSYGDHQWVNPVLAKKITIIVSSPTSRFTDPKTLASRTYMGTSFAGPRMEDGQISSWWMVDLGKDHQLMCNYYTLRQDGSRTYPRSWKLQGSMDGNSWADVRVHEDDQTMCKLGQFASWPIVGANSLLPFRYFRVVMTGPTADASNPWSFCICFLELYGYFR